MAQEYIDNAPGLDDYTLDTEVLEQDLEEQLEENNVKQTIKLDYSLESPQERNELVKKIIDATPPEQLTPFYIKILTDYIIFAMTKEEQKQKKILTDNRMVTLNKHETSYQGLISQLESGEDGLYNMTIEEDKNIIFSPKVAITIQDLAEIPELQQLKSAIQEVEKQEKKASGKKKYLLKKQLIEMHQDQYVIKNAYKKPIHCANLIKSASKINLSENITINPDTGEPESDGYISLFNPKHISLLLCNYVKLKEDSWGKFTSDSYYVMRDLDDLIEKALKGKYPLYYDLLIHKIDGKQNVEIQSLLEMQHGVRHSIEYISSLWRNKIPKIIAEQAKADYLVYYYTNIERGQWKKCSRCGEIKLAHNKFFSRNKTAKDGWYSICKCCRNKKGHENLEKTSKDN